MAETNSAADNSRQTTMDGSGLQSRSAVHALLTLERAQKLDLLNHLITNLQQSLVVCGPEGIGKTTLLENLKANKLDSWIVYSINATAPLSFEQVQVGLEKYLQQRDPAFAGQKIDQISNAAEEDNQKIVFLIDDAGLLVPGLINSICQLAEAYSSLRVVFALTADEVHLKNNSDRTIDECHFIEIPTLSESQCGDFLKNLASKPDAIIPAENLNATMIGQLYKETHGIPGKIVNIQKNQNTGTLLINWQWISLAAAILLAVTVSFFLWDEEPDNHEKLQQQIAQNLPKQQAEKIVEKAEPSTPVIEDIEIKLPIEPGVVGVNIELPAAKKSEDTPKVFSEAIDVAKNEIQGSEADSLKRDNLQLESKNQIVSEPRNAERTKGSEPRDQVVTTRHDNASVKEEINNDSIATIDKNKAISIPDEGLKPAKENQDSLVKQAQIKTADEASTQIVKEKADKPGEPEPAKQVVKKSQAKGDSLKEGTQWVLNQKVSHYSLQLMAISKQRQSALLKLINKNSQFQDKLHYFETVKKGEEIYVLLYGNFSTPAEAKQAMKLLPKDFGKPWLRSFKLLHKQVKAHRG